MDTCAELQWISLPLSKLAFSDIPRFGAIAVVYALRLAETKEVLYIGSTGSLGQRLFVNYLGGWGGDTTQRVHSKLFDQGYVSGVELGYIETAEYKGKEVELKRKYRESHNGKLPPWNRV